MRIAIVNDSGLAREALRRVVTAGGHTVAWQASDGEQAIQACKDDRPDVLLMDLRMPVMNGVECTRRIMAEAPCLILVVTATVEGHRSLVYDAMGAGALDVVNTPVLGANEQMIGDQVLLEKIERIGKLGGHASHRRSGPIPIERVTPPLIAIGASTGGPDALAHILSDLKPDVPAALVIVQHVNAEFAPGLAEWLTARTRFPTSPIRDGDVPRPGTALLAATDDHVVMTAQRTLRYTPNPKRIHFRPSVDVFFESLAEHWPAPCAAAILTGMGNDGARGLLALRGKGWHTIAQDEATSVVYGMPREAAKLKAAKDILALPAIGLRLGDLAARAPSRRR
jgi:two-component system, chemotaxis family, response regulator WspF